MVLEMDVHIAKSSSFLAFTRLIFPVFIVGRSWDASFQGVRRSRSVNVNLSPELTFRCHGNIDTTEFSIDAFVNENRQGTSSTLVEDPEPLLSPLTG